MLESELQRAALDYLRAAKIVHWRMPLGAVTHSVKGREIRKKNPLKGFPDIAGIINKGPNMGAFFAIELKSKNGRMTQEQVMWAGVITGAGGFHAVVRSIDELQTVIATWF